MRYIILLLALSGCSLTPTQQRIAMGVGSVLILGAIAAHQMDHGDSSPDSVGKKNHNFFPACQAQKGC